MARSLLFQAREHINIPGPTKLPGPSSEYIFKQCTLHVCSGFLM
jgi:hypothetical protein